jgi:hypothetical protein
MQTLLVVFILSMYSTWTFGQLADPIIVNIKNTGTSFTDQFAAAATYAHPVIQDPEPQFGSASLNQGSGNTLIFTFTPNAGAVGSTDVIVSYYTLSVPMNQVTRSYRFNLSNEVVTAGTDHYVVDKGATDIPLYVLQNDSITAGQITLSSVSVSNAGDAVVNSTGDAILFTPTPDFEGDTL